MRAVRLRTEYLNEPLGLGNARPRFSWTCEGDVAQSAYRIVVTRDRTVVWDSGRVESSAMTHIRYGGEPLASRDQLEWSVTLWNEQGVAGPQVSSRFEVGLLDASDWTASWISGDYTPKKHQRYPVDHFRKTFSSRGEVRHARLYVTALGVYDAWLNGRRVGRVELAPGSTDYRKRVQYHAYDVTELLVDGAGGGADAGSNTVELRLADGWYRGSIGCFGPTNVFGRQTKILSQLEITYETGERDVIASDESWQWSNDGPIRCADLKDGEIVDAALVPSFSGRARVVSEELVPVASDNVAPVQQEVLTPTLITTPSGARVLDFGQNIAGFVGFTITAHAGQKITLLMGETLDEHGEFTQANMQAKKPVKEFGRATEIMLMTGNDKRVRGELQGTPLQRVQVTLREGETDYQTAFAVFGFRYALLDTDVEVDPADFRAVAVYSDMEQTGTFDCSNGAVNQLVSNTRWSMKGNFLDVPTDCPTRERLGWTGDAQVFFDTASYLMDVASFYRKWLRDMQDNQLKSGKVSAVIPYNGIAMMYDATGGSVGWADAAVLVPYRLWKKYGDEEVLREFYPMMRRYAQFMIKNTGHKDRKKAKANPHNKYVYEKGMHLGEWLEPEEFRDDVRGKILRTEEATAYLHYTMTHLAEIALHIGEFQDADLFEEYAQGAQRAYAALFSSEADIDTDRQAKLVRPLALGLDRGEVRARRAQRLVQAVENRGYRIGTGFLSTPFVLPVLTEAGRSDVAYKMLENEEAPSWLAEVKAGATTVWEDWEGTESLNHYSPGAVCQWLFDTVAGIRVAGENTFEIAPIPGGTLTYAQAEYDSMYGRVTSRWELAAGHLTVAVSVPVNTTAHVRLPNGDMHEVTAGNHTFTIAA